jgi:hypothetical protein
MVSAFTLSAGAGSGQRARHSLPPPARQQQRPVIAALPDKSGKSRNIGAMNKHSKPAKAVKAEELIPLNDDELNDF